METTKPEIKLTFPMYLNWKHGIIETLGYVDDFKPEDLKEGKGYVSNDGMVFRYCSEKPKKVTSQVPYFYPTILNETTTQFVYKCPLGWEESLQTFGVKQLIDWSYQKIINDTKGDEILYNEDMINDMNVARSKYVPIINEDDDCLKKIIKYTILKKDIDINRLKSAMDTPYALTNMRSALISSTKMSITYFLMWVELLGIDFSISVEDSGIDKITPLKESLVYRSYENAIYAFDPKKYKLVLVPTEKANEDLPKQKTYMEKLTEKTLPVESEEEE